MIPVMRYLRAVLRGSGLAEGTRALALAIAAHCDPDGLASPSIVGLAEILGRDPGTIRRRLHDLETAGILTVDRRTGCRNRYRFPVAAAAVIHNRARLGARGTNVRRAHSAGETARVWTRAEALPIEAAPAAPACTTCDTIIPADRTAADPCDYCALIATETG